MRDLTRDKPLPHRLKDIRCPIHGKSHPFSPRLLPIQSDYRILSLDGGGVKDLSHQQNNILIADFRSFFAGGRTCWLSCSQGISLCAKL